MTTQAEGRLYRATEAAAKTLALALSKVGAEEGPQRGKV